MTSHVRGQDYSQEAHSKGLEFVSLEVFHKVVSLLVHNGKGFSCMHVLIDGTITVAHSKLRHCVDMIAVSEAIVIVVMTDRREQCHESIHIIQLGKRDKSTFSQKDINHLKHVRRMHFIVILHCFVVSFEDSLNKIQQFVQIYMWDLVYFQAFQDIVRQDQRCLLSAIVTAELDSIEIEAINLDQ